MIAVGKHEDFYEELWMLRQWDQFLREKIPYLKNHYYELADEFLDSVYVSPNSIPPDMRVEVDL